MSNPDKALVSVIIPFLNRGKWLAEAIESVICQSYSNWEVILINDGSNDGAGVIAKEYSYQYPEKIIYAEHPGCVNKGVTISRNLGISLSKGSFIAFLDADDLWLEKKLVDQLKLFKQYPQIQMICEASRFWYSWDDPSKQDIIVNIGVEANKLYFPPKLIKNLYPLGKGQPPCPTGIILKKEAFERSGGFEEIFTGEYQLYEDQAFLSKIYLNECIYISANANNLYRKRSGSLTEAATNEKLYKKVRLFFLKWLEKYIIENHLENNEIVKLIVAAKRDLTT